MTTTCRSDVVLGCAAVILTLTAASPGACQRLADSTTHGAVDVRTTPPPREHTVREGETLWQLAAAYLGDAARWKEIAELNPQLGDEPRRLVAGSVVRVPAPSRPQVTMRIANGEAPVPIPSAGEIDARFQGRTVFYRPRPDSIVAPVRPAPPDSSSR